MSGPLPAGPVRSPSLVRSARPEELDQLLAIERASDELFATVGFHLTPGPATLAALGQARQLLVVGDPPVGFARIEEVDGLAHLEQLSVHPDRARQGLGRTLLEAACAWAAEASYRAITLSTFAEVPWNAPFYASAGFAPLVPLTPGLVALRRQEQGNGLDELGPRVVMVRRLPATAGRGGSTS